LPRSFALMVWWRDLFAKLRDVHFVEEHDPHVSATGAKGVGEIGITGVAASIANAVFHATGKTVA
jgi:CO/xanthine dehydrogenase Mo-binding subunit